MADRKIKLVRTSTTPLSLKIFCKELLREMQGEYDVLAISSSGKELDDLNMAGIPTRVVEMRREISPIADLKSLFSLIRLLKRERPQIVHSITPKAGLLTMIAAKVAGVPIRIHSFTGLLFPTAVGIKRKILKTTDRITCACATHILPEGNGVKNDLINSKITKKPLQVLGYGNLRGIDLCYYDRNEEVIERAMKLREEYGVANDAFVFVFVGRIVKDKGIGELISAFRRIVKIHEHVHLMLVGEEEPQGDALTPDIRAQIQSTPNIHRSQGWIEDVRPYYAMADALVFPSYREGFPNVVLEAGAMGLPSIVTDINGSNEIIQNDVNGNIIPVKDADTLYEYMLKYVTCADYLAQLSANCRDIITSKFDAIFVRTCLKNFYHALTSNKQTHLC